MMLAPIVFTNRRSTARGHLSKARNRPPVTGPGDHAGDNIQRSTWRQERGYPLSDLSQCSLSYSCHPELVEQSLHFYTRAH
jgi:hypothetical protein